VKAFRIIQEDYYKIKILLVLKSKINEFEKQKIESNIRLVMGEDCRIIWDFVEDIPKTSQGKYLYTKSNILK
jgi:phenylacetate-CoA ligase